MDVITYLDLKSALIAKGYSDEITWVETIELCDDALEFAREHCFVVCNSGMKAQIALKIFHRCWKALVDGRSIDDTVFRNKPKREAMKIVYDRRIEFFDGYQAADDKLSYLETLPYIGSVIKYHLARNLGVDCCKPDRHLVRVSERYGLSPNELCSKLAAESGNRIGAVDLVIWRAANLGMI